MTTEYMILTFSDSRELSEKVTPLLHVGWKLQGGVSVAVWVDEGVTRSEYAQALYMENWFFDEIMER